MERHGLRFNGWLMNAWRSSSNLLPRRGTEHERGRETAVKNERNETKRNEKSIERRGRGSSRRYHSGNRFLIVQRSQHPRFLRSRNTIAKEPATLSSITTYRCSSPPFRSLFLVDLTKCYGLIDLQSAWKRSPLPREDGTAFVFEVMSVMGLPRL